MKTKPHTIEKVAENLLRFVERKSEAPFFTSNWSAPARQALCELVSGKFDADKYNIAEIIGADEAIEILYVWLLTRRVDTGARNSFISNPAPAVRKFAALVQSIHASAEYTQNGRSTAALTFKGKSASPVLYVDVTNTIKTGARTGIQRVVREIATRLRANNVQLVTYQRSLKGFVTVAMNDGDFASSNSELVTFAEGDIYFDIDASWGDGISKWALYRDLKINGVRIVNMHYDAVPILSPQNSHPTTVIRYVEHFFAALSFSDLFVCISEAVRDDASKIASEIQSRCPPMVTIPMGGNFSHAESDGVVLDDEVAQFIAKRPYVLCVGTVEPRKNYPFFIDNIEYFRSIGLNVLIVGKKGWEEDKLIKKIQALSEENETLKWLQNVDDAALQYFYENCFAYATSSWYEGYGLPVLEALAKNCVVISSDRGALVEAGQGLSLLFDPRDFKSFTSALEKVVNDPSFYAATKENAARVCLPSWEDTAQVLMNHIGTLTAGLSAASVPANLQLVYISTNPENLKKSLESFIRHSKIDDVVVLTRGSQRAQYAELFENYPVKATILCDEEVLAAESIDVSDHQERNFLLRECLYKRPEIHDAFVALDDDCIAIETLPADHFVRNSRYVGKYFYPDMSQWRASPFGDSSYDRGQWYTATVLEEYGYPRLAYSSHQAQVIDKQLFSEVVSEFRHVRPRCFDEWSIYFNVVAHRYSNLVVSEKCTTLFWPMSYSSWTPEWFCDTVYFENYYDSNYQPGGAAYEAGIDFDTPPKLKKIVCKEAYGQYSSQRMVSKLLKDAIFRGNRTEPYATNMFGITESAAFGTPGLWCRLETSCQHEMKNVVYEIRDGNDNLVVNGMNHPQLVSQKTGLMVKLPATVGSYILTITNKSLVRNSPEHRMPVITVAI
ncbi:glycosyltransferase family 4 protein [Paraburkholderia sp. MMS20-SJTR3]|uniref:Glycosyltransferase family 4 protein n=1 Tax=Paraburkholderia sejongensis TaxID=2886946 RepID=A0ABS8K492_9BURK|nr:glycosyltransferase family 1 protein [Paraburkholderia sp. MMS20-SJTR3]MCC8396976.1 glycosyltransferase family 4 protein [Paraburkholderia sp. MMS20-SJTR3]